MKKYSHMLFAAGFGSILLGIYQIFLPVGLFYFVFVVFFALCGEVCDLLDFKLYTEHERRFLSHSPLSPLLWLIAIASGIFSSLLHPSLGFFIGIATYLVILTHLFLDSLNPSGVPLFSGKRIVVQHIPYDNWLWNFGFSLLGAFFLFMGYVLWFLFL